MPATNPRPAVWLTLSKAETKFEKILNLKDIFQKFDPETGAYSPIIAQDFWQLLSKFDIKIHPMLLEKYHEQQTCLFCGGQIIRVEGLTPERFEERCLLCNYIFKEENASE